MVFVTPRIVYTKSLSGFSFRRRGGDAKAAVMMLLQGKIVPVWEGTLTVFRLDSHVGVGTPNKVFQRHIALHQLLMSIRHHINMKMDLIRTGKDLQ